MKYPFIKLLQSPYSKYFYDVNKNDVLAISDDTYNYLKLLIENDLTSDAIEPDEVTSLKKQGYLSCNRVEHIEHPLTDYLDTILNRNIEKVTLQLTQNCNFRCEYCNYTQNIGGQRHHSTKRMSEDIAHKAIIFLRDHSVDIDEVYVGFYGGEPLLEFPMLKRLILFAEDTLRGKDLHFTITTNASLLSDEIVKCFVEHHVYLIISIDGPKRINDKNRRFAHSNDSTFENVIHKLQYIYENYPDYFSTLFINMVINPSDDFDEISRIFVEYPFLLKLNIRWSEVDDILSNKKNIVTENYASKFEYQLFLAYLYNFNFISNSINSHLTNVVVADNIERLSKLITQQTLGSKGAPGGPCIPGESHLMVTADGNFIVCERVSETSDAMIIGNISSGFDMQKVKNLLNVSKGTAEECKRCWAFSLCNLCAKYSDINGKLSSINRKLYCNFSLESAEDLLRKKIFYDEMRHKIYDKKQT